MPVGSNIAYVDHHGIVAVNNAAVRYMFVTCTKMAEAGTKAHWTLSERFNPMQKLT